MMDVIGKTTLSEAILVIVMLVILPLMLLMLLRIRRYEAVFGLLPEELGGEEPVQDAGPAPDAWTAEDVPDDVFPYTTRTFLSPSDRACIAALRETFGEVDVYPRVALWEWVEATDRNPGYSRRMAGKALDFLVCDKRTGMPLTGIMYRPEDAESEDEAELLRRICDAAGANVAFIDKTREYNVHDLRKALGLPVLDD